jgi:hypothetical protein
MEARGFSLSAEVGRDGAADGTFMMRATELARHFQVG